MINCYCTVLQLGFSQHAYRLELGIGRIKLTFLRSSDKLVIILKSVGRLLNRLDVSDISFCLLLLLFKGFEMKRSVI